MAKLHGNRKWELFLTLKQIKIDKNCTGIIIFPLLKISCIKEKMKMVKDQKFWQEFHFTVIKLVTDKKGD